VKRCSSHLPLCKSFTFNLVRSFLSHLPPAIFLFLTLANQQPQSSPSSSTAQRSVHSKAHLISLCGESTLFLFSRRPTNNHHRRHHRARTQRKLIFHTASTSTMTSRVQLLCQGLPKLSIPGFAKHLDTFTLFPKLPPELRDKIWGYAARDIEPREIFLMFGSQYRGINGKLAPPALLQATGKSRTAAKLYYTLCMDNSALPRYYTQCMRKKNPSLATSSKQRPVWINFAIDIFVYGTEPIVIYSRNGDDLKDEAKPPLNFEASIINRIQHVELQCGRGLAELRAHMKNLELVLSQISLTTLKVLFRDLGRDVGHTSKRSPLEFSLLRQKLDLRVRSCIKKQQQASAWDVPPQIVFKRSDPLTGQFV